MAHNTETITAIATPSGRGGIGVIRLSGPDSLSIASSLLNGKTLKPRQARFSAFVDDGDIIDEGLAIYFAAPNSFTGEDVVELQGHGGPVVLDTIIKALLKRGARQARPGEFSERAFLNDKLDLAQAEAIADLIDANSTQAARNAVRSLQGEFSQRIHALVEQVTHLRMYVEAAIDFPEEEIDFLGDGKIAADLDAIEKSLAAILTNAKQGALLREGITVVIAGKPNAGKSSLLNALAGRESAIVTDIAGTTRDVLREHILIDGMPLHVIDTAGLRESDDVVEQEGVKRARAEIDNADRVLLVIDDQHPDDEETLGDIDEDRITRIYNKCDLSGRKPIQKGSAIWLAAKHGLGLELLRDHLKDVAGLNDQEQAFTARRRHLDALARAQGHLEHGKQQLHSFMAGELLAEELRLAQNALSEITGAFTSDELLGRIFSSFCIGK